MEERGGHGWGWAWGRGSGLGLKMEWGLKKLLGFKRKSWAGPGCFLGSVLLRTGLSEGLIRSRTAVQDHVIAGSGPTGNFPTNCARISLLLLEKHTVCFSKKRLPEKEGGMLRWAQGGAALFFLL